MKRSRNTRKPLSGMLKAAALLLALCALLLAAGCGAGPKPAPGTEDHVQTSVQSGDPAKTSADAGDPSSGEAPSSSKPSEPSEPSGQSKSSASDEPSGGDEPTPDALAGKWLIEYADENRAELLRLLADGRFTLKKLAEDRQTVKEYRFGTFTVKAGALVLLKNGDTRGEEIPCVPEDGKLKLTVDGKVCTASPYVGKEDDPSAFAGMWVTTEEVDPGQLMTVEFRENGQFEIRVLEIGSGASAPFLQGRCLLDDGMAVLTLYNDAGAATGAAGCAYRQEEDTLYISALDHTFPFVRMPDATKLCGVWIGEFAGGKSYYIYREDGTCTARMISEDGGRSMLMTGVYRVVGAKMYLTHDATDAEEYLFSAEDDVLWVDSGRKKLTYVRRVLSDVEKALAGTWRLTIGSESTTFTFFDDGTYEKTHVDPENGENDSFEAGAFRVETGELILSGGGIETVNNYQLSDSGLNMRYMGMSVTFGKVEEAPEAQGNE